MLSTCSSAAGADGCRPPQAGAPRATPTAAASALNARQFSPQPLMELSYDVLLGHDHATRMRTGPQAPLIEFTHLSVFGHHQVGEINNVAHVEVRIGQSLRR